MGDLSQQRARLEKQAEELHKTSASYVTPNNGDDCEAEIFVDDSSEAVALFYDPIEFYEVADLIASEYGIGGCRSLSEFANMINKEDPVVVSGFLYAIESRRLKEAESIEDTKGKKRKKATGESKSYVARDAAMVNDSDMGDFLANSGIPQSKIREARERLKNRKITAEEEREFFNWLHSEVTTEKLKQPGFDVRAAHARIQAYLDTTEKFNITASMIGGKRNG
jgi:hypothetical protein